MEIADYLRVIKKRAGVVLLIPVLAAILMTAIVLSRPSEYSSTATVAAPWLISNAPGDSYATANGPSQFVADFTAAISLPPVVEAVAQATGASPDSIRENVTATPIGESTLIQVRFVGADRRQAEPVARAIAVETLRFLFRPSAVASASQPDEGSSGQSFSPVERLELLLAQPETVSVSPTQVEPTGPDLMRGLQVAIGGGLLLGLLVVIALEMLPFGRRRIRTAPSGGDGTEGNQQPSTKPGDGIAEESKPTSPSVGADASKPKSPQRGRREGSKPKSPSAGADASKPKSPQRGRRERSKPKSPSAGAEGSKPKSPSAGADASKPKSPSAGDGASKPKSPSAGVSDPGNGRRGSNVGDGAEGNGQGGRIVAEAADGSKQPSPSAVGKEAEVNGQPNRSADDPAEGSKQPSPSAVGEKAEVNGQPNRSADDPADGSKQPSPSAVGEGAEGSKRGTRSSAGDGAGGSKRKNPSASAGGTKRKSSRVTARASKRKSPNGEEKSAEGDKRTSLNAGDRKSTTVADGNEGDKRTSPNAGDGGESTEPPNPNAGDHADGNEHKDWIRKGNKRMSWTT
jgi:capsular polysaccharide biosynthesis protein